MKLQRPILAAIALSLLALPLAAQTSGNGFLFRKPVATLNLRGGFSHASAGSDIFSFSAEQFTLGRGDFSGPTAAADLGINLTQRLQLVLGTAYSATETGSEYRDWVDNKREPIEQTTTFARAPVTASLKAYLAPTGRSVGKFAWVPSRYAPYVGAGGGGMWYRFKQAGDFFNSETFIVRSDNLESQGWTKTAHAFAGVDLSLSPRFAITTEGRYDWAEANLDPQVFSDFEPIDLSGLSATVGIHIRM